MGELLLCYWSHWLQISNAIGHSQHCPLMMLCDFTGVQTRWIAVQLLFVPTAMAMYACLVSHHLLDSSVFKVPPGCRTSPEGEVMLAALFTLMSWRGIYSSHMF